MSSLLSYPLHQGKAALVVVYLFALVQARFTESDKTRLDAVRRLLGDRNVARLIFGIAHTGVSSDAGKKIESSPRCNELSRKLAHEFSPYCQLVDLDDSNNSTSVLLQLLAEVARAQFRQPLEIQQELVEGGKRWKETGIGRVLRQRESRMDRVFATVRTWMNFKPH